MPAHNALARDLYLLWTYGVRRARKPYLASCKLTYRCNLTCQQCPFRCMWGEDPSFEQVETILDQLYRRGNRIVIFEGGEPTLWKDGQKTIYDVVAAANRRFTVTGMTTNGTLPLDIPVDVLWVSVDGLEQTHNELRGANIWRRVMDNIRASRHPNLLAHITANSRNAGEVPELVRLLSGLVRGITLQFYYPYHKKDELFLDFDRREALLNEIIAMKRQGYPVLNSIAALKGLRRNTWTCADWLIDNANPDGSLSQGCYLRGRDDIDCNRCGFSPHTEISLARQGNLQAMKAGIDIFFSQKRPKIPA